MIKECKDAVGNKIKVGDIVVHCNVSFHGSNQGLHLEKGRIIDIQFHGDPNDKKDIRDHGYYTVILYKKDKTRASRVGPDKLIKTGGRL